MCGLISPIYGGRGADFGLPHHTQAHETPINGGTEAYMWTNLPHLWGQGGGLWTAPSVWTNLPHLWGALMRKRMMGRIHDTQNRSYRKSVL